MATGRRSAGNPKAPFLKQTDIFVSGEEGYHTYRIPAVVVSDRRTILAFCEGRKHSRSDRGDIDLVLRRSLDNGKTWQPMQIIADDGANTMGNPSPVVDRSTGTVWLLICRNNDQVYAMKSGDDGATWSNPLEVTKDVKKGDWGWYATGPCHGVQLRSGRLVIPCDHRLKHPDDLRDRSLSMYSHVIYSDDHGSSWRLGGTVGPYMNECTVVQTSDGSLYLNMRNYTPQGAGWHVRAYAWSRDGGVTWSGVKFDDTLIEPVCQASVARFTDKDNHDRNRVLFSNPASQVKGLMKRAKMTVRLSYDECRSWNVSKLLHPGPSAYSDLAVASDMTICCLYERGEKIPYEKVTFANFNIEWLTDGADHLNLRQGKKAGE